MYIYMYAEYVFFYELSTEKRERENFHLLINIHGENMIHSLSLYYNTFNLRY